MHRISTQPKAHLCSLDLRLQSLLNFSYVLKIATRFVKRNLSFRDWQTLDGLARGEAVREVLGSIRSVCCSTDSASARACCAAR
jgi:hypothetical protein